MEAGQSAVQDIVAILNRIPVYNTSTAIMTAIGFKGSRFWFRGLWSADRSGLTWTSLVIPHLSNLFINRV